MRPRFLSVSGRYHVPRPFTLYYVSRRLGLTMPAVSALVRERRFPHAYLDIEGRWRVPAADVDAYVRWRNSV